MGADERCAASGWTLQVESAAKVNETCDSA